LNILQPTIIPTTIRIRTIAPIIIPIKPPVPSAPRELEGVSETLEEEEEEGVGVGVGVGVGAGVVGVGVGVGVGEIVQSVPVNPVLQAQNPFPILPSLQDIVPAEEQVQGRQVDP